MVPGGWGASIPARSRQLDGPAVLLFAAEPRDLPRSDLGKEVREIATSIADAEFGHRITGDVPRIVFFNIRDTPGLSALLRNARMGSCPDAQ